MLLRGLNLGFVLEETRKALGSVPRDGELKYSLSLGDYV